MSPSISAPVSGSTSQASGSNAPGVSSFIGKLSTSVSRSMPRNSRFTARMPSSSVSRTLTRQGLSTPSASSARRTAFRISPAASLCPRPVLSREISISCSMVYPLL